MTRYAASTSVPMERSRAEIERILSKYGATRFGTMNEADGSATVYFEFKGRQIQLPVPMPPRTDKRFARDKYGMARVGTQRDRLWEQEQRRRWRVLVITIKAVLEAVETGLVTFEQVFLAHIIVIPGTFEEAFLAHIVIIPGTARTVGEAIVPKLDALYSGVSLPALLAENP